MNIKFRLGKFSLFITLAMLLALALTIAFATPVAADGPPVFINEIHYDNVGGDADEGVEIAGPAGTDLTGWKLVPYNGNGGRQYSPTNLSGTIPDQQNGFGTLWFPISGLQNGAPDGIALVAPGDVVIQFLSYEGDFTATDGPANGMTSTDIGVSESGSTPSGHSLQLQGTGNGYDGFTWSDPITHTRGAVNTGQTLENAFSIAKLAPNTVSPGEFFTYTILVRNHTGVTPTTTTITDVVPAGVDFVAASDGGSESGGVVTWVVSNFADGETLTRTFRVQATGTQDIENVNYGVNGGGDWITTTMGTTVTTQMVAGLMIDKSAPVWAPPGEAFTYTLTFENQTAQTINDLWISDTLPLSLTYASSNPAGTWDAATHTITWTESASIAHDSTLTYTLVVTAPAEMTVVSNADYVVSSSNWPTPTVGDPVETLIRDCNTIYGIQHTTDPGSGTYPSPCAGENVTVRGIVYAVYGSNYFIAEGEGPWHGIYVYDGGSVSVGDEVEVTGNVVEYYGVTEFSSPSNVEILSSGNDLYGPSLVMVDEIPYDNPDVSEGYEGVFVETRDITVTATGSYGIWAFTDTSDGIGKADDWAYTPSPAVSDTFALLRGPLAYDYSEYKIMPRDADDALEKGIVVIEKDAPATVDLGGAFTYTLTIANQMGFTLDDLVITDTVPDDTTFAYALDSGAESNGVVSWTVSTLDHLDQISVSFVVTAANVSGLIINNDYAVSAANHVTPTFGKPVNTAIGKLGIYHLQGEGFVSPYEGQTATVEGVVTADFQENNEMHGFFMQDPIGDGLTTTSDGIFVYATQVVSAGNWVEVTGVVQEYDEMTQIGSVSAVTVISSSNTIEPTEITLPEDVNDEMERYEGMWVTIPHTLTVQQNYFQGRFGQVTLGSGDRMYQPTHLHEPGSAAYLDQVNENARRLLVLDDGSTSQNPDPIPYIGVNDTLRAGDVVAVGLTGVLDQGPINTSNPSTKDYRLHPTANVVIDRDNERSATPPDVGGRLQVASFNVLNYFTTLDTGADICGPSGDMDCRGADNAAEFDRQRTKIITALLALDADVVGLMEIENNGYGTDSAIYDLVEGLNAAAGAGTYAFVDPGVPLIGTDAIAVGLLYKPGTVTPVGAAAILDNSFDPNYLDGYNRPALAQTFEENATGERFTAAVNHLKSKGSSCDAIGDPDTRDGQGNCNLTRTRAMSVEVSWLATDPTNSGDPDFLIIGDLNAYAMEDPISVAKDAGYTDLLGSADYTYVFDGQSGYLDHALANPDIHEQATGAAVWHINADEPSVIDYNTEYKPQDLYAPDAYRSSDHDPVLVGLNLVNQTALTVTKDVTPKEDVQPGDFVTYTIVIHNDGDATARGVVVTDTLPPEVDFGAWVFQGSAELPPPPDDEIVWGPWDITAWEAITYTFTAQVKTGSLYFDIPVTNAAVFDSINAGSGTSNEATFTTALATAANLSRSTKTVDPTGDVTPGDRLTYTVTLHNSGQAWAYVTITDTLPGALLLESGFDGASALTWSGWAPGGESVVLTLTVQADPDISSETSVYNVVAIDDGESALIEIRSPDTTIVPGFHYIYLPLVARNYGQ